MATCALGFFAVRAGTPGRPVPAASPGITQRSFSPCCHRSRSDRRLGPQRWPQMPCCCQCLGSHRRRRCRSLAPRHPRPHPQLLGPRLRCLRPARPVPLLVRRGPAPRGRRRARPGAQAVRPGKALAQLGQRPAQRGRAPALPARVQVPGRPVPTPQPGACALAQSTRVSCRSIEGCCGPASSWSPLAPSPPSRCPRRRGGARSPISLCSSPPACWGSTSWATSSSCRSPGWATSTLGAGGIP
mmetsp:Transcript_1247/g.4043  ORF Transcript_1247/g.4043 Transcript_1247/m.4043 type:complete len:243 (-) Transcript_1247:220-948(-)